MIYLCRHGDTPWSTERRLAGTTDLPLTEAGEKTAKLLGDRLKGVLFEQVRVSPLQRARKTVALALPGVDAQVDDRLREMMFGDYEGKTVDEIRKDVPGWAYLKDGAPNGESPADVGARADAVLADITPLKGHVAIFAHSAFLRVLAARYLGLEPGGGRLFQLSPGALSILSYDHVDDSRAIAAWNLHG